MRPEPATVRLTIRSSRKHTNIARERRRDFLRTVLVAATVAATLGAMLVAFLSDTPDNWTPIADAGRYFGIVVTGTVAIINASTQTKVGDRLTRWGKRGLAIAVIGFAVALASQVASHVLARRQEAKREEAAAKEVADMATVVEFVNREAGRFGRMTFAFTIPLGQHDDLTNYARRRAAARRAA